MGTTKQIPRTSRVEVEVAAPVHAVWQVLADVTRTGEWSHECQRVTWLDGATSASYGARFRGGNKWLAFRWSRTNEIIELEPDHVIAWRTVPSWRFPDSTEWRFTLEASTVGTRITQTYELVQAAGVVGVVDGADGAAAPRPERRPRCRPAPDRGGRARA